MATKIQITSALLGLLGLTGVAALATRNASSPPVTAELQLAVNEHFAFEPAQLRCAAGALVQLHISHLMPAGGPDLPHATVLLELDTDVEAFAQAVVEAQPEDSYVPAAFRTQVLAFTPLLHSGHNQTLSFQAPAKPGRYPLVCSFPGHCLLGMKATLIVE